MCKTLFIILLRHATIDRRSLSHPPPSTEARGYHRNTRKGPSID